jgi:hypothetical protein
MSFAHPVIGAFLHFQGPLPRHFRISEQTANAEYLRRLLKSPLSRVRNKSTARDRSRNQHNLWPGASARPVLDRSVTSVRHRAPRQLKGKPSPSVQGWAELVPDRKSG